MLAVGTSNPNLAVPGLCASLLTDLGLVLPIGMTDATGAIGEQNSANNYFPSEGSTFVVPNSIPGLVVYSLVRVQETLGSNAIPVINSNGRSITMPTSSMTHTVSVSRLFNNLGGTTATRGMFVNTTTLGYGLVTRFTY